ALQPLMVLETDAFLVVLGKGWLASKAAGVLDVAVYSYILWRIAGSSALNDKEKAVLLVSSFFVGISFIAYRFDDYHVICDIFRAASMLLLLALSDKSKPK